MKKKCESNVYSELEIESAQEMLIKARIMSKILQIINSQKISNQEAATIFGVDAAVVKKLLSGHFHNVSIVELSEALDAFSRL